MDKDRSDGLGWYIDAWAVKDGYAFASQREPEQIDANASVFIRVPSLIPVPIGRMTTGLRATRGNFQSGFFNLAGREIRFDSLEQVIELVRRAYIIGDGTPEDGPGLGATPPIPGGPGGAYYENQIEELGRVDDFYIAPAIIDAKKRKELFSEFVKNDEFVDRLFRYLRAFGEAIIIEWINHVPEDKWNSDYQNQLKSLCMLLAATGIWDSPGEASIFAGVNFYANLQGLPEYTLSIIKESMASVMDFLDNRIENQIKLNFEHDSLLWSLPCPLLGQSASLEYGWYAGIRTLFDKKFLALSTSDYYAQNKGLPEFIPGLLIAVICSLTEETIWKGKNYFRQEARLNIIKNALHWLNNALPQLELPQDAEMAISQYAWGKLEPDLQSELAY